MSQKTPPLNARGRYQLKAPWQASMDKVYRCIAIRSFDDIYELGMDVFLVYYEPLGIARSTYDQDRRLGANIITLATDDNELIYVPDTYIASYPDMSSINYSHVVLSCSLGPLADHVPLEFLTQQVANVVSDTIGIAPTINVHLAPHSDAISPEQHEVLEAARAAAIKNRSTDYARVRELQIQNGALLQKVAMLEQIIKDKGLLS